MADFIAARNRVLDALYRELVGPDPQGDEIDASEKISVDEETAWMPRRQANTGEEILTRDAPNRRYGIGVLYSGGGRQAAVEVTTGEGPLEQPASADGPTITSTSFNKEVTRAQNDLGDETTSHDLDLSGANEYRPTTMAITFLADLPPGSQVKLAITGGRYQERDVAVGAKTRSWRVRFSCSLNAIWDGLTLVSASGRHAPRLEPKDLEGMAIEAFAVSRPRGGSASLLTVGVVNRAAGSTPNQFLFQVSLEISLSEGPGRILAYPEAPRTVRDEEEESIELLDRDVPTFAIGHGCAAGWGVDGKTGECLRVRGEALPAVDTPSITPQVFRAS